MAARSIRAFGPSNFSTELRASGGTAVRSCVCGIRARAGPVSQGSALLHFFYPNRRAGELLPGRPRGTRHSHTPSPVRNPQGEITPSLGLDRVFIPKKKKRRSCVGPAQYPSMSLPRDQGEVARGLAQMKVVLNSANHSEGVQRGTTRTPDILWRSCGLPRFKMKTPAEWQPPGEVRRPGGRGTSVVSTVVGGQGSEGQSIVFWKQPLRDDVLAPPPARLRMGHSSLLMPTATAIYFILRFVHIPNVRRCGCVSGALSQSSIREEAAKPK